MTEQDRFLVVPSVNADDGFSAATDFNERND